MKKMQRDLMWKQNKRERARLSSEWKPTGARKHYREDVIRRQIFFAALAALVVMLTIAIAAAIIYFRGGNSVTAAAAYGGAEYNSGGNVIRVRKGDNLQAALDRANPGDTITLEAGATFNGGFNLPKKSGAEFITIRSSAADNALPAVGKRLDPIKYKAVLPIIANPNGGGSPAITATNGAHHYRFIGVAFGPNKNGANNIILLGSATEKTPADLPHHIEIDRCYIYGSPTEGQRRGIAVNGRYIKVLNSYIKDIKLKGEESQGIAGWAGDGPFEIVNNYVEGGGENILIGGADSVMNLTPADIIIRDNHLHKPIEWLKEGWLVKNIFEIKHARRVKVTHNLMTNNWAGGQNGNAVLFTVREHGNPNSFIEDVEFSNNIIRHSPHAVNVYGSDGKGGRRLIISNNIFDEIEHTFLTSTDWDGVTIENNTVINQGNITMAYGKPVQNLIFRNNIIGNYGYGLAGEGTGGLGTIAAFFPGGIISNNAFVGNPIDLRQRNAYPMGWKLVGFVDFDRRDFRLRPESRLATAGHDNKSIGATLDPKTVGGN